MFRKGKLRLITGDLRFILTFAVLAGLLTGVAISSFAYDYSGIHWYDSDLPVTWEINENGTADCTGEFDAVRTGYQTRENVSGSYFTPRPMWEQLFLPGQPMTTTTWFPGVIPGTKTR